jgi:hypothetical protein
MTTALCGSNALSADAQRCIGPAVHGRQGPLTTDVANDRFLAGSFAIIQVA